jgi:hypothetical protein
MGDANNLGDLQVNITGDFSELQTAIDQSVTVAQDGSQQIASALQGIADASGLAGGDLALFKSVLEADAAAGITLEQSLSDLADSAKTVGDEVSGAAAAALEQLQSAAEGAGSAADGATGSVNDLGGAITEAGKAAEEGTSFLEAFGAVALGWAGLELSVAGIKEIAAAMLETYANVEKATIALTALTGSASAAGDAIAIVKNLAIQDALSFPGLLVAYQRMAAFGFATEAIPGVLQAAADAAAATGRSFDTVTNSISRMALSGTAASRQLATLGISLQDLGTALGTTSSQAAAAFKALDPSDRLVIIEDALQKYQGVAQAVAQGVAGQFQNLETQADFVFESMGQAIAPAAEAILGFASKVVLPTAQLVADAFAAMGSAESLFASSIAAATPTFVSWAASFLGVPTTADQVKKSLSDASTSVDQFGGAFSTSGAIIDAFAPGVRIASEALGLLALGVETVTNTTPGADSMIQQFTAHLNALSSAARMGGTAFTEAWNFSLVSAGFAGLDSGTVALVASQQKLRGAVAEAQTSVTGLTLALSKHITVSDSGISTVDLLAAAHVKLTAAQKALATSLGESTKATKDAKDSWDALVTTENKNNDALKNAQDTWDALSSAFNAGKDSINGMAVNLKTLSDAANNVAAAYLKATGAVQQWDANAITMAKGIQDEANQFTTLQNAVSKTSAVFLALQAQYKLDVEAGTATDQQLQKLTISYNDNQKAIGALQKATEPVAGTMADVKGQVSDLATVMVNGKEITLALTKAQNDQANVADLDAKATGDQTKAVVDQNGASATQVLLQNAVANATGTATIAHDADTSAIIKNTGSTNDNVVAKKHAQDAADVLAQHEKALNDAWAAGDIVVQRYDSDVVHIVGSANDAATAQGNLNQKLADEAKFAISAEGATNDQANALIKLATDADAATAALTRLNSTSGKSGGGKSGGATSGGNPNDPAAGDQGALTSALLGDMAGNAAAQMLVMPGSAIGGAFVGAVQVAMTNTVNMAQAMADATGQVVTFGNSTATPVNMAKALAATYAALVASNQAATAATTANTTAITANTTAATAATTAATATVASLQQIQAASDALTAAEAKYAADLASGVGNLTQDLTAVGDAATALSTITGAQTDATVASTTATQQNTTAATASTAATTAATVAATNTAAALTDTGTALQQSLLPSVGQWVNGVLQATSTANQWNEALQTGTLSVQTAATDMAVNVASFASGAQAITGVITDASNALSGMATGVRDAVTGVLNWTASLNQMQLATQRGYIDVQTAAGDVRVGLADVNSGSQALVSTITDAGNAFDQVATGVRDATTGILTWTATLAEMQVASQRGILNVQTPTGLVQVNVADLNPGGQGMTSNSQQYGPGSSGYEGGFGPNSSVDQYPAGSAPPSVQLTVNVTGNSVTSQALVDQLANKVGSAIITNLRTVAGLKLS